MDYEKDFKEMMLETKDGTLFCKVHEASGTPIILIHGLAASSRSWKRLVEFLPDDKLVYIVDLIGHGLSDAPDTKYSVQLQVDAIKALVKNENLKKPVLVGHSYGGWISLAYAMQNPVAKLIIEDSAGLEQFYTEVNGTESREKYKEELLEKASKLAAKKEVIEAVLNDEFSEGQLRPEDLASISVPTLIIWGADDDVTNIKYSRIFETEIKDSRLSIVNGAGHTPHFTNAQEVAKLILDFSSERT
jgi:pimeloyl-ACP methyl ester carboxylesterase